MILAIGQADYEGGEGETKILLLRALSPLRGHRVGKRGSGHAPGAEQPAIELVQDQAFLPTCGSRDDGDVKRAS
ncbi:hypothetical protein [Janthinobacterium sp. ROICE36]|uniref:hypothetical protein n=1 Tax=Janthinobacterium sp. ROICE36 TaxID=2048670 RepID=UPI0015E096AB|nr:hypothetical protein [Janthinobacterium sp. ROICE36]